MSRLRADRREERRSEAISRNAAWAKLSRQQKINSLKLRRGASTRQHRLLSMPDALASAARTAQGAVK